MPSANRFILPGEGLVSEFRRRPIALAAIAATGGLLCGAVLMNVIATPGGQPAKAETTVAAEPAASAKEPAAKSEKHGEEAAAAKCEDQTWPYLSRSCLTEAKPEVRGVRVVSTDRLTEPTIGAIEARSAPKQSPIQPPTSSPLATPAASEPAVNPPEVVAAAKALDYARTHPTAAPATAPAPVVASTPAPAVSAQGVAATPSAKAKPRHTRVAKSSTRRLRDAAAETVAAGGDDEDAGDRIVQTREGGRHIVKRWIERDYRGDDGTTRKRGERSA